MQQRHAPVTTIDELATALAALPKFSRKVYIVLKTRLYDPEPCFSDVEASDIARDLICNVQAVNAALGHLYAAGLAFSEDGDVNGTPYTFLHTYEHAREIGGRS